MRKKGKQQPKRRQLKDKADPEKQEPFYKLLPPIQPPLYDVLEVQSGVVMREGNREKRGEEKLNEGKMTRKEYLAQSASAIGEVKMGNDMGNESARAPSSRSVQGTRGPTPTKEKTGLGNVPEKAPVEPLKGKLEQANLPVSAQASQAWDAPTRRSTRTEDSALSDSPTKPDLKAKLLAMGQRARMPRDRPYVEHERTKLPPPVFPGTQGHGFVTTYLADANPLAKGVNASQSKENLDRLKT